MSSKPKRWPVALFDVPADDGAAKKGSAAAHGLPPRIIPPFPTLEDAAYAQVVGIELDEIQADHVRLLLIYQGVERGWLKPDDVKRALGTIH